MSDVKHPITLNGYGSLPEAAKGLAALRYDAMALVLHYMAEDLDRQAQADSASKTNLATEGFRAADEARKLETIVRKMMDISRPHMKADLGERPEIVR